ncbi:MAG: UDP-N-acetylmuramoyl-tripeptide--D-alanyl-D-alanine ligase [Planctomycetota bacterium]
MRPLTLEEMVIAIEGRVFGTIATPSVTSVSTDSRDAKPGCLFVAIKGDTHDGHAYVADVLDRGASAAVISDLSAVPAQYQTGGRLILVQDTIASLGRLATWYRRQFAAQVIAVVGSNGKTTTKDMVATVLGHKRKGRSAKASFNNHIGVPMTLLSVEPADEFIVVEIGTNHPGEIAALGRIAKPDIAIVTSIGEEHLEFFGSLDGVAGEEFSILSTMRPRAFVALSQQAARFAPATLRTQFTVLTYGLDEESTPAGGPSVDLRATDITSDADGQRFKVNGRFEYRIPVLGRHNVVNALAAIAIGTRFRMTTNEIAEGVSKISLPPMRMQPMRVGSFTILNDAYNANPSSMAAAFEVLDGIQDVRRKVLILGDMRELGDQSTRCHQTVGRDAGRSTAQVIIVVGAMARVMADGATASAGTTKRIHAFPTVEALTSKLPELIEPDDLILLKASRGVRLERLVDSLQGLAHAER